ncbi:MAG: hypothetical protein NDJ89_16785 [Oligoflexia bacterium]|nr:hypothetical protein [Oligoflexia bacterium]
MLKTPVSALVVIGMLSTSALAAQRGSPQLQTAVQPTSQDELEPGPILAPAKPAVPVRMARADVKVHKTSVRIVNDVPHFEFKELCTVSGEVPVYDFRTDEPETGPVLIGYNQIADCQDTLQTGRSVSITAAGLISLRGKKSGAADKSFSGLFHMTTGDISRDVFLTDSVGASTEDLGIKTLSLTGAGLKYKENACSNDQEVEEIYAVNIRFNDANAVER